MVSPSLRDIADKQRLYHNDRGPAYIDGGCEQVPNLLDETEQVGICALCQSTSFTGNEK
ncbi:MAG TPA: hypothetical protein VL485_25205 [Ktedonobacteraceae bacterium]|nr:hypothetical protein [Ktedonobacteraceae bacterium]